MATTEKKKREEILTRIETASENLGLGDRWGMESRNPISYTGDNYGLCGSCKNRIVIRTRYTIKVFRCSEEDYIKLSVEDPVVECSRYEKLGSLTLTQMAEMAHLIELKIEKKVGF